MSKDNAFMTKSTSLCRKRFLEPNLVAIASLALILFLHPDAQAGWDQDCIQSETARTLQTACGQMPVSQWADDTRNRILKNPGYQDKEDTDFFWAYMIDQNKQTKCEQNMLGALDLLPQNQLGVMHINDHPQVNTQAKEMQKIILNNLFDQLPALAEKSVECDKENEEYAKTKKSFIGSMQARLGKDAPPDSYYDRAPVIEAAQDKVNAKCGDFEASVNGIWSGSSGSSAPMHQYIKAWIKRYQDAETGKDDHAFAKEFLQNSDGYRKRFLQEALPVNDWTKEYTNDSTNQRHKLIFEEDVVTKMQALAADRKKFFDNNMTDHLPNGQPAVENGVPIQVPIGGRNTDFQVRKKLMSDGGAAATAFMERDPQFRIVENALSCHLNRHYYQKWKDRDETIDAVKKKLQFVGGVVTASAFAAGTGGVGLAALALDSAALGLTVRELPAACARDLIPGTLQATDICKLFKPGENKIPDNFGKSIQARASCGGKVFETAVTAAAVFAGGGAVVGAAGKATRMLSALEENGATAEAAQAGQAVKASTATAERNVAARAANAEKAVAVESKIANRNAITVARTESATTSTTNIATKVGKELNPTFGSEVASAIAKRANPKQLEALVKITKRDPKFLVKMKKLFSECFASKPNPSSLYHFLVQIWEEEAYATPICYSSKVDAEFKQFFQGVEREAAELNVKGLPNERVSFTLDGGRTEGKIINADENSALISYLDKKTGHVLVERVSMNDLRNSSEELKNRLLAGSLDPADKEVYVVTSLGPVRGRVAGIENGKIRVDILDAKLQGTGNIAVVEDTRVLYRADPHGLPPLTPGRTAVTEAKASAPGSIAEVSDNSQNLHAAPPKKTETALPKTEAPEVQPENAPTKLSKTEIDLWNQQQNKAAAKVSEIYPSEGIIPYREQEFVSFQIGKNPPIVGKVTEIAYDEKNLKYAVVNKQRVYLNQPEGMYFKKLKLKDPHGDAMKTPLSHPDDFYVADSAEFKPQSNFLPQPKVQPLTQAQFAEAAARRVNSPDFIEMRALEPHEKLTLGQRLEGRDLTIDVTGSKVPPRDVEALSTKGPFRFVEERVNGGALTRSGAASGNSYDPVAVFTSADGTTTVSVPWSMINRINATAVIK